MAAENCVCCRYARSLSPAIAHWPDRRCLPRWGCGSACEVHGVGLHGRGENRDPRLLREYGDGRPCHARAYETGAVQGHFARLRQRVRLHFLARPSGSVNRARVSNDLWAGGILVARCLAGRAVDQTRPLPPYNAPHHRLIAPKRAHAHACGAPPGASSAASNHAFPRS